MLAVDTIVLTYAHRVESEWHEAAARLVTLGEGVERWALPVFCVIEFVRVVTHKRMFNPPSTVAQAADFITAEGELRHWSSRCSDSFVRSVVRC